MKTATTKTVKPRLLKPGDTKPYALTVTKPDGVSEVHDGVYYVNGQHRKHMKKKSYWTVTPNEEVECFEANYEWYWRGGADAKDMPKKYFGILTDADNDIMLLGTNRYKEKVRIARFIPYNHEADGLNRFWHGYPACYWRNDQDVPSSHFLRGLASRGLISGSDVDKIIHGQTCRKL